MARNRIEIKKERTREKLVESALSMFQEKGYAAVTVNDITERADLGHGTFYQYFKSKQDLLITLAQELTEHIGDYFYTKSNKSLNLHERLYYGVYEVFEFCLENKDVFFALHEAKPVDEKFEEYEEKVFSSLYQRIRHDIEYFIRKKMCREGVDEGTIFLITCMCRRFIHSVLLNNQMSVEEYARPVAQAAYYVLFEDNVEQ